MLDNFSIVKTQNSSFSLFNKQVNDVYHSNIGGEVEAYHKFILPSGLLDFVAKNNKVRILDICFGLGLNSKVAVEEIFKINPMCDVEICCLEYDYKVLGFSCLLKNNISDGVNFFFNKNLLKSFIIKDFVNKVFVTNEFNEAITSKNQFTHLLNQKQRYKFTSKPPNALYLHNIYYRTISSRNIYSSKMPFYEGFLGINFYIDDARSSIKEQRGEFDFIFHDPFTPSKLPTLWTVEFFSEIYKLLSESGNLTTYSCSSAVRSAMLEVGFKIENTKPIGRNSCGTIAYKNNIYCSTQLNENEIGLLQTKSGIPYRDTNLNSSSDEIINNRKKEQDSSLRQSTSSFYKNLKLD